MSTKKQPAADLPATTTTPPAKPKKARPSRSKAAIAERKAAAEAAQKAGVEWFSNLARSEGLSVTPARDGVVVVSAPAQAAAMADEISTMLNTGLDDQIAEAVAALDAGNEDPHVVRGLADVDGEDPFAEETAAAKLKSTRSDLDYISTLHREAIERNQILAMRAEDAEHDADQKRAIIEHLDERIADLQRLLATRNTEIERLEGDNRAWQSGLAERARELESAKHRIVELEGFLRISDDERDEALSWNTRLNAAIAGIQRRGLIARILNRAPVLPLSAREKALKDFQLRNSRSTTHG